MESTNIIIGYPLPTTTEEAVAVMQWLNDSFNGGFHPDDDPREIVCGYSDTAENMFTEEAAVAYETLRDATWELLNAADIDIYELSMRLTGHDMEED